MYRNKSGVLVTSHVQMGHIHFEVMQMHACRSITLSGIITIML